MGILSFRLKKLKGEAGESKQGEIRITSSLPEIKNVEERDLNIGTGKQKVLAIEFAYKVDYEPIKATIEVEGEILYKDTKQKQILKKWKDKKQIDEKYALPIMNFIFRRCSIAGIKIADELQLLPPVKLPEFVKKE
jgi:hypothetical protein